MLIALFSCPQVAMPRLSRTIAILLVLTAHTGAYAQGHTFTRTYTCATLKAYVAQAGHAVLASSEHEYEMVHRNGGACQQDETSAPAYEPTSDVSACFVGWRCKQRDSDNGIN